MNFTKTNPKGIDKEIGKIQSLLHEELGWENIDVYGRVYKNQSTDKGLVPEFYIGANEYKDAFLNDAKTATICFIEDEKHTTDNGIYYYNDVKIVVMVNLSKAKPSIAHRADTEVQIDIIKQAEKNKMFTITGIEKGIANVFKCFNVQGILITDMQPFHVFAITGTLKYKINC